MLIFSIKMLVQGIELLQFRVIAAMLDELPWKPLYVTLLISTADFFRMSREKKKEKKLKLHYNNISLSR